jgi:hypothetical protein
MRADGLSPMLLVKEHNFRFTIGAETHLFVVEELVAMLPSWPERFRLRLAASADCEIKMFYGASAEEAAGKAAGFVSGCEIKTFYGASAQEAARKAADFVSSCGSKKRTDKTAYSSPSRPLPPRQILLPQQIQESESD